MKGAVGYFVGGASFKDKSGQGGGGVVLPDAIAIGRGRGCVGASGSGSVAPVAQLHLEVDVEIGRAVGVRAVGRAVALGILFAEGCRAGNSAIEFTGRRGCRCWCRRGRGRVCSEIRSVIYTYQR